MTTYQWLSIIGVQALVTSVMGALVGLISSIIQRKSAERLTKNEDLVLLKRANQAIIRDILYNIYQCSGESVSLTEMRNELNLYEIYHQLGANGVMDELHEAYSKKSIKEW